MSCDEAKTSISMMRKLGGGREISGGLQGRTIWCGQGGLLARNIMRCRVTPIMDDMHH